MSVPISTLPLLVRGLLIGGLGAGMAGLTGCNTANTPDPSSRSVVTRSFDPESGRRERRGRRGQATTSYYSRIETQLAYAAFKHWEREFKDEEFSYALDPYNRKISPRLRQRIDGDLSPPELPGIEDHRIFAFEKIELPEGNWAFVIYREGNKYHSVEYASVFRAEDDELKLIDHFTIAEGLMDAVLREFQWPAYRKTFIEPQEAKSAPTP